ncbi:MAG: hypothetical protein H6719_34020 [Sandaracinaceae bacterium]|nr:hypothetical protein [Sandaracinaceae bacterium]
MKRALLLSWALALLACGEQRVELFDACATCGDASVVDVTQRDPERCGPTLQHCEDDEYCIAGACVCRPSLTRIGERCVETSSDPDHCGGEARACSLCAGGACVSACPAATTECEGACVDTRTSPLHCGECGRPCGSDATCVDGVCVEFRPAPCTSCPCGCARACCTYPGRPTDAICVEGDACP